MIIDSKLLDKVAAEAFQSHRLRMNYNLHENSDSKAQKIINVLLPGTAISIHRHQETSETFIILQGKLFVVFYNDMGAQTERYLLDSAKGNYGVEIPKGQWHGIEVIEPSAVFEVKDGPYTPVEPENMLD